MQIWTVQRRQLRWTGGRALGAQRRELLPQRRHRARLCRAGMYVPSDSFGGASPERRASQSLQTFLTFVAAKVVMSQLEGIGRGDLGSYNAEAMTALRKFMQEVPMRDGSEWLERLMQENEMLGVRIMEVRAAYAKDDFEWKNLERLTVEGLLADNTQLMRRFATQRFSAMLERSSEAGEEEQQAESEEPGA